LAWPPPRFLRPGLGGGSSGAVVELRCSAAAAALRLEENGFERGVHAHGWPGLLHTLRFSQNRQAAN
jgi:hypothetical protein